MKKQKHSITKNGGFTLIEVLIVILIISIVGGIALLTINKNKTTQIKNIADQLSYLFQLAEDQALLQPTVLGATVQNNQIKFYEFKHDATENKDMWVPTNNRLFSKIELPNGISIRLKSEDDDVPPSDEVHPQIIFSSSGEVNPFTILLGKNNHNTIYKITGAADGRLQEIKL